jgi:hypothetical protein
MNRCVVVLIALAMLFLMTLGLAPARAQEVASDTVLTPIQFSIYPPVELPNENCHVYGLSLGVVLVGLHTIEEHSSYLGQGSDTVIGLQICGLLSFARELCGLQVSGFANNATTMPWGLQVAGVLNYIGGDMGVGLQVAGGWNRCASGAGLQLAMLNEADKDFAGIQAGLLNFGGSLSENVQFGGLNPLVIISAITYVCTAPGVEDMRGLQLGLVNKASDMYGIQCGLIWNHAKCARGLQLGLINTADSMAGFQVGLVNIIKESPVPFLPIINAHF